MSSIPTFVASRCSCPYCTVFHCQALGCQIPAIEQAFVERTLCAHSPPSCVTGCQTLGSDPILSWGPCSNPTRQFLDVCVLSRVCVCAQSYLTLCGPMDCSSPGSSVHEISQTRRLEWVVISYSRESSWPRDRTQVSCVFCIGRWILYHHLGSTKIGLSISILQMRAVWPRGRKWLAHSPEVTSSVRHYLWHAICRRTYAVRRQGSNGAVTPGCGWLWTHFARFRGPQLSFLVCSTTESQQGDIWEEG